MYELLYSVAIFICFYVFSIFVLQKLVLPQVNVVLSKQVEMYINVSIALLFFAGVIFGNVHIIIGK